jgi:hypothetical protein
MQQGARESHELITQKCLNAASDQSRSHHDVTFFVHIHVAINSLPDPQKRNTNVQADYIYIQCSLISKPSLLFERSQASNVCPSNKGFL